MSGGTDDVRRELLQRRQVVEDVESASVRADDEVVEVFLDHETIERRWREATHERCPARAVVE